MTDMELAFKLGFIKEMKKEGSLAGVTDLSSAVMSGEFDDITNYPKESSGSLAGELDAVEDELFELRQARSAIRTGINRSGEFDEINKRLSEIKEEESFTDSANLAAAVMSGMSEFTDNEDYSDALNVGSAITSGVSDYKESQRQRKVDKLKAIKRQRLVNAVMDTSSLLKELSKRRRTIIDDIISSEKYRDSPISHLTDRIENIKERQKNYFPNRINKGLGVGLLGVPTTIAGIMAKSKLLTGLGIASTVGGLGYASHTGNIAKDEKQERLDAIQKILSYRRVMK